VKKLRAISGALSAVLLLSMALTGCATKSNEPKDTKNPAPSAGEQLDKELNLYNWAEYMPDEVLQKFEAEYGVKVRLDTFSSNEELYAKLKAGGSGYDLIFPSGYMVTALKREGLISPIDKSALTNLKNLDPNVKDNANDPNYEYSVPYLWGMTGIAMDASQVDLTRTPVTSFKDLWKPEFKNKLVMVDDSRELIGMTLKTLGYGLNETDPAKLEQAKVKLKELQPNIKAYNSDSFLEMLQAKEVVGGVVYSGAIARGMMADPNLKWIFPAEGVNLWMDNMAIPKDAPHKKTALAFINFVLRPEISKILSDTFPYSNPNAEANKSLDEKLKKNPATTPPAEEIKKGQWLADIDEEAAQLYDRIFTEVKG
jgi:spermidine/putrescine-binding protein